MGHMQTQPSLNFERGCPKVSGDLGKTVPPFLARCFESATSENFAVGNRKSTCSIKKGMRLVMMIVFLDVFVKFLKNLCKK